MKILILGHGRHGKDTAAEYLAKACNFKFASSSEFANEHVIFPKLAPLYGYQTLEECFADRGNHRDEWRNLIREYNSLDRARLARNILEENDIYVGMRCHNEYAAAKDLFDVIVWVDASSRHPREPSMTIEYDDDEMIKVDNNRELPHLHHQLDLLVELLPRLCRIRRRKQLMRWVSQHLLGGRPMKRISYAFADIVSGEAVYYFEDTLGRRWMANNNWSLFRVPTEKP